MHPYRYRRSLDLIPKGAGFLSAVVALRLEQRRMIPGCRPPAGVQALDFP